MIDWSDQPFLDTMMTTIVFYGFDKKLPASEAKVLIDNICGILNETPSHFQIGLYPSGIKSRTPKYRMVDKAIAKGDFDNYSYFKAVKYFEKNNISDCSIDVGIGGEPDLRKIEIHFPSSVYTPSVIINIIEETIIYVSPHYGIMFDLTVRKGPRWFINGIISSGMPSALGRLSGEFKHEYLFGKKFSDGFFRDVFPWNYLSQVHLDKEIEGVRFQDWVNAPLSKPSWIGKPKTRGTLSLLPNGGAVWELTKEEAAEVRPRMKNAGLLMVKS